MAFSHRHHRKGLRQPAAAQPLEFGVLLRRGLWQPRQLNWWIGTVFACGSALFIIGGILSLAPQAAASWALDSTAVNSIFFAGSIPFTAAAYLQLYQAANAPESVAAGSTPRADVVYFGWRPGNLGWLASALQFAGTLLFNVNTFDAMQPDLDWLQQDLEIWGPDMAGSILFLASGYLAFKEWCQAHWAWHPHNLSWWITFINLLGCVAFMLSAVLAFVPPAGMAAEAVTLSIVFTVLGAVAFLIGALLLWPEAAQA